MLLQRNLTTWPVGTELKVRLKKQKEPNLLKKRTMRMWRNWQPRQT